METLMMNYSEMGVLYIFYYLLGQLGMTFKNSWAWTGDELMAMKLTK